jgi:hypothetical protein
VRFEVLTTSSIKKRVFWDISPCNLAGVDRLFIRAYCVHHQGGEYSTRLHGAISQKTLISKKNCWLRSICRWFPFFGTIITATLYSQSLSGRSQPEHQSRPHCVGCHCSKLHSLSYSIPPLQRRLSPSNTSLLSRWLAVGRMCLRDPSLTRKCVVQPFSNELSVINTEERTKAHVGNWKLFRARNRTPDWCKDAR